jgi:hypothetical protein
MNKNITLGAARAARALGGGHAYEDNQRDRPHHRDLHAGRLRLLEEILDEAEAEHEHTTAMWAYDEFQHMANDTDRARALRDLA